MVLVLGGIIPSLGVFRIGWRLLYKGTFISVTKTGVCNDVVLPILAGLPCSIVERS